MEKKWIRIGNMHEVINMGRPDRTDRMFYYYMCSICGKKIEVEEGKDLPTCDCKERRD